ncbi:MAG: hypothetical protein JWN04_5722 [Myxococcaceae bacterium]|nr:hypothetical protein [Myxococcaceae bacterium]
MHKRSLSAPSRRVSTTLLIGLFLLAPLGVRGADVPLEETAEQTNPPSFTDLDGGAELPIGEPEDPPAKSHGNEVWLDVRFTGALSDPYGTGTGETGLGYDFGLGVGWGWLPVTVGFDFMQTYGHSDSSTTQVRSGMELLTLDKTQQNHILFFHTWLRVQPTVWRFRPYLEGFVGGQWYKTDYSLEFEGGGPSTKETSTRDRTSSLGFGAGIDLLGLLMRNDGSFGLTFGFRRVYGGHASLGHTFQMPGKPDVVVHYPVATDMNVYTLGLHFRVGR